MIERLILIAASSRSKIHLEASGTMVSKPTSPGILKREVLHSRRAITNRRTICYNSLAITLKADPSALNKTRTGFGAVTRAGDAAQAQFAFSFWGHRRGYDDKARRHRTPIDRLSVRPSLDAQLADPLREQWTHSSFPRRLELNCRPTARGRRGARRVRVYALRDL
jgi:hypothetical protein